MSELLHWKTEPAGLFITRDRLAANAAHAACTRIELKWLIEITGLAKKVSKLNSTSFSAQNASCHASGFWRVHFQRDCHSSQNTLVL